jgi:hypothetical protein
LSICDNSTEVINASSCNGINCCQTSIPSDLVAFITTIAAVDSLNCELGHSFIVKPADIQECKYAFLVEETWFQKRRSINKIFREVPVALEWGLPYRSSSSLPTTNNTANCIINHPSNRNTTFTCSCKKGFEGNPYLDGGCQGKVFVPSFTSINLSLL